MIDSITYGISDVTIKGYKYHDSGAPVMGGLVVIYSLNDDVVRAKTTTDQYGRWSFTVLNVNIPGGPYEIRYYGTGLRLGAPPIGSNEPFEVIDTSVEQAKTIALTATSLTVREMADGTILPPLASGITLSAVVQNPSALVSYRWYKNESLFQTGTMTSYQITGANFPVTKDTYRIEMFDPALVSADTITITRLKDGSGSISIILSNEAHSIACDVNGYALTGELGSSGKAKTTVYSYYGTTALTPIVGSPGVGQFTIQSLTPSSGVTVGQTGADVVFVSGVSPAENSGYVDIVVRSVPLSSNVDITKRFSFTKGKPGAAGAAGAGVTYRGIWSSTKNYVSDALVRDVVKYNGTYYYCIQNNTSVQPPSASYWTVFGSTFESIATGILLAEDAAVTRSLVLGQDVENATYYGKLHTVYASGLMAGNGFYLEGTSDSTGRLRMGAVANGALSKGMYWDGPNNKLTILSDNFLLSPSGYMWADSGGFGGNAGSPKIYITTSGLIARNSTGLDTTFVTAFNDWRFGGPASMAALSTICDPATSNGGFESGTTSWQTYGTAGTTSSEHHSASNAAYVRATNTPDNNYIDRLITPTANTSYSCNFYYKMSSTDMPTFLRFKILYNNIEIYSYDLGGKDGSGTNGQWLQYTAVFTAPGTSDLRFRFCGYRSDVTSFDGLFIDDVTIKTYAPYSELNAAGLVVANSPSSYIRFGSGKAEIKVDSLDVNNINVVGNLTVYGTTTSYLTQVFTGAQVFGSGISVTGPTLFNSTINANSVASNIKLRADGTTAHDGFVGADANGIIYLSNWNADRGWKINADGTLSTLGTGATTFLGNVSVSKDTPILTLNDNVATNYPYVQFQLGGVNKAYIGIARTDGQFITGLTGTGMGFRAETIAGTNKIPMAWSIDGGATAALRLDNNGHLLNKDYSSQTTGWRVTQQGDADFRYLYVDELHAKAFIADLEQALAGGQIICKSVAKLVSINRTASPYTGVPAAGATADLIVESFAGFESAQVFVNGDLVRIRNFFRGGGSLYIGNCWGTVALNTSYGGAGYSGGYNTTLKTQAYTFTRSAGTDAGTITTGTVVAPGTLVLDYGVAGNGYYEVNAIDGPNAINSPYAQVVTWATHPNASGLMSVRGRFGNLIGISDSPLGSLSGYGLYSQSSYLTGNSSVIGNLSVNGYGNGVKFYAGKKSTNLTTYSNGYFSGTFPSTKRWATNSWGGQQTATYPSATTPWNTTENVFRHTFDAASPGQMYTGFGPWTSYGGTNDGYIPNSYKSGGANASTFTFSFYARASSAKALTLYACSPDYVTNVANITSFGKDISVTTSWKRFSFIGWSFSFPSNDCHLFLQLAASQNDWVEFTGAQLERFPTGETACISPYMPTAGKDMTTATGYGMWAAAGGFGGTMNDPAVEVADYGLKIIGLGTSQSLVDGSIMIGNITAPGSIQNNSGAIRITKGSTLATSGFFGYGADSGTNPIFKLALDGSANIAGWDINSKGIGKGVGTGYIQIHSDTGTIAQEPPSVRIYDTSSKVMATMGRSYWNNNWQNEVGFVLVDDYTSGIPYVQFTKSIIGNTLTAQIAGWNFNTAQFSKTISGTTVSLENSGSTASLLVNDGSSDVLRVGKFTNQSPSYGTAAVSLAGSWDFDTGNHTGIVLQDQAPTWGPNQYPSDPVPTYFYQESVFIVNTLTLGDVAGQTIKVSFRLANRRNVYDSTPVMPQVYFDVRIKSSPSNVEIGGTALTMPTMSDDTTWLYTSTKNIYVLIPSDATQCKLRFYFYINDIVNAPVDMRVDSLSIVKYTKTFTELNELGLRTFSSPVAEIDLRTTEAKISMSRIYARSLIGIGGNGDWTIEEEFTSSGSAAGYSRLLFKYQGVKKFYIDNQSTSTHGSGSGTHGSL